MDQKKILVVDDELDMRIYISTLLKTSGYHAFSTKNGKDGVLKAKEIQPDLIFLDVMMPGEGGVIMYQALKTDDELKKIPVVMLTAVKQNIFCHYLKMLNARLETPVPDPDGYLGKPPDHEELLNVVKKLLTSS